MLQQAPEVLYDDHTPPVQSLAESAHGPIAALGKRFAPFCPSTMQGPVCI
jgi:hypothetical protein